MDEQKPAWLKVNFDRWQSEDASESEKEEEEQKAKLEVRKFHVIVHKFQLCGSRKYPDPHHGGNWKFQGGGGVRGPGNSKREGGWTIKSLSRGAISFRFRPEFEHCFLPTW